MTKSKLFFVVDGQEDDTRTNNEIFETLEKARKYAKELEDPKIWVAIVRNYYREDGGYTYEDLPDTFEFIKEIKL